MNLRMHLTPLLAVAALLCACGDEGKTVVQQTATVVTSGGGPSVVDAPTTPEPVIAPPPANMTLYKVRIYERASQKPISGARVMLLRTAPDPLFMREPARKDVIMDQKTRAHGLFYQLADADGAMKYALVSGPGFFPTLVEAGPALGGKTQEIRIDIDLIEICRFIIKSPNGDRADEALCTMKPDEDAVSNRPGLKANYGWSERADALGVVLFNREPGTYRLEFSDRDGKHRWYERFTWDGQKQAAPREITLPETSQDKPW